MNSSLHFYKYQNTSASNCVINILHVHAKVLQRGTYIFIELSLSLSLCHQ